MKVIAPILNSKELNKAQILRLLSSENPIEIEQLRQKASELTLQHCGETIYLRELIEFSNYCVIDCYCRKKQL